MSSPSDIPEVPTEEAAALLRDGALLLDVREDYEWEAGHVAGALHIALGELPERAEELPAGRQVVVTCRAGGRSARAVQFLLGSGVDAVNMAGGMQAWAGAGLPFEASDGSPGTVA
jgi:rhodanese-related sulfurtransferase